MLDRTDPVVEAAVFGREVEEFLNGRIGSYLLKRSEDEIALSVLELKKVLPWRTRRIRELQNRIWRAESFQVWLADAVIAGQNSLRILEDNDG